jgi:hypothetical protein
MRDRTAGCPPEARRAVDLRLDFGEFRSAHDSYPCRFPPLTIEAAFPRPDCKGEPAAFPVGSGNPYRPRKRHRARASAVAAREMPQEETMIRNQRIEMEGVEMRIGVDASVEANGPKEESKARTCGLSSDGLRPRHQLVRNRSNSPAANIADRLTRLLRAVIGASLENTMKRHCVIGILLAALIFAGSAQLSAQAPVSGLWPLASGAYPERGDSL